MQRRAVAVGAGLGALLGAAIAVVVLVVGDGDGDDAGSDDRAATTTTSVALDRTTSTTEVTSRFAGLELDGAAAEFADLVDRATGLTYHVRYEASTPPTYENPQGSDIAVDLWRRPPAARRDTVVTGAAYIVTREFLSSDGVVRCVQTGDTEPICVPTGNEGTDPSDPLMGAIDFDLSAAEVSVSDALIANRPSRCFVFHSETELDQEICLSQEGFPVRISDGDSELVAVTVELSVDPDVLLPPETVGG
jgi:hypothetical protein